MSCWSGSGDRADWLLVCCGYSYFLTTVKPPHSPGVNPQPQTASLSSASRSPFTGLYDHSQARPSFAFLLTTHKFGQFQADAPVWRTTRDAEVAHHRPQPTKAVTGHDYIVPFVGARFNLARHAKWEPPWSQNTVLAPGARHHKGRASLGRFSGPACRAVVFLAAMLWRAFETLGWGVAYYQTAQAAGKYFRSSLGKSSSHGPATELAPPPPPPTLLCADTSSASTATASATAIGVTATPPGGGQDLKTTETTREGEEEDLGKNWVAFWTVATIIGDHVAICMPIRRVFLFLSVVSRGAFPGWFWRRILRPIAEENEEKVEELVDWVKMKVLEHGLRLVDLGLTEANLKLMASLLWSLRRGGVKKGIVEALEAVAGGRDIVAYSSPDTKSRKASRKRARGEDYELGDGRPCKLLVMEATPAACRSGPRPSCRESGDKCE